MGIWIFYLLALVPVIIGGIIWYRSREVNWMEWLGGSAVGFALALIFQFVSVAGMTHDVETWSGRIESATHWPRWVEQYQQAHTRTVGSGKNARTETYYTTEYRTHPEHWTASTTIPDEHDISESFYQEVLQNFGGKITTERPSKSGFYSGDRNSYVAYNTTGYIYPVTALKWWENRVKAAPTLFSFAKVPTNVVVHPWPENENWRQSDRLVGTAAGDFNMLEFDRMNARLGPIKMVNVIMVGFVDKDGSIAEWQRAKWLGGKKNDLVLCYGGVSKGKPTWAKVFGWSDSEICKRNLETILISNTVGARTLGLIEKEITDGYTIKDWTAFDYITVEPPAWSYWVFAIVLIMAQGAFYLWANNNEYS